MAGSQASSKRPRTWRQMVTDIEAGRANETTAGEAYRLVLLLLREQESGYGEEIWRPGIPEERTNYLRAAREQLKGNIAITEALLKRVTTAT